MGKEKAEHVLFARIPLELWKRLQEEARSENRSATGQVITILRERYASKGKEPRR